MYYLEAQISDRNRPTASKRPNKGDPPWGSRIPQSRWKEFQSIREIRIYIERHPVECERFNYCEAKDELSGMAAYDWKELARP